MRARSQRGVFLGALLALVCVLPRPAVADPTPAAEPEPNAPASAASSAPNPYNPVAAPQSPAGYCSGASCVEAPQQIAVTTQDPASAPGAWPMRERIAWIARLLLVILGYAAVMIGSSMLKKIERQSRATEQTASAAEQAAQAATQSAEAAAKSAQAAAQSAEAALSSAQALLLHAQKVFAAERPWILVSVEETAPASNVFVISATNRGRSPARLLGSIDRIFLAPDESALPQTPDYTDAQPVGPKPPFILLPGESASLHSFHREDVVTLFKSREMFKRIESWKDKIFLSGRIHYEDLSAPQADRPLETSWCCQYMHGPDASAMSMVRRREYNHHT